MKSAEVNEWLNNKTQLDRSDYNKPDEGCDPSICKKEL